MGRGVVYGPHRDVGVNGPVVKVHERVVRPPVQEQRPLERFVGVAEAHPQRPRQLPEPLYGLLPRQS